MSMLQALFYKLVLTVGEYCVFIYDFISQYSAVEIALGLLSVVIIGALYHAFFVPLDRRMEMQDVTFVSGVGQSHMTRKELANQAMRRKKLNADACEVPVYPNGWFCLAESRDIKIGDIVNADYIGLSLAVFRDEKGEVHAIDANCPHMGADFTVGGRVFGDCVECPFHGWRFSGQDGKCTSIPYADTIPPSAKVKSYKVLERNKHVYMWFHAEGEEPAWFPPILENIHSGAYTYGGRTEHFVNCHIEDLSENGADVAHLNPVHRQSFLAGTDLRRMFSKLYGFSHHEWYDVNWTAQDEPNKHIGILKVSHSMGLFGKLIPIPTHVTVSQVGPAIVYLNFGSTMMLHHVTPIGPYHIHVRHQVYSSLPLIVSKLILSVEARQIERDIMIWNSKKILGRPVLSRSTEDELIARHRRWYSQFYSKNSPRLKLSRDTLDW